MSLWTRNRRPDQAVFSTDTPSRIRASRACPPHICRAHPPVVPDVIHRQEAPEETSADQVEVDRMRTRLRGRHERTAARCFAVVCAHIARGQRMRVQLGLAAAAPRARTSSGGMGPSAMGGAPRHGIDLGHGPLQVGSTLRERRRASRERRSGRQSVRPTVSRDSSHGRSAHRRAGRRVRAAGACGGQDRRGLVPGLAQRLDERASPRARLSTSRSTLAVTRLGRRRCRAQQAVRAVPGVDRSDDESSATIACGVHAGCSEATGHALLAQRGLGRAARSSSRRS